MSNAGFSNNPKSIYKYWKIGRFITLTLHKAARLHVGGSRVKFVWASSINLIRMNLVIRNDSRLRDCVLTENNPIKDWGGGGVEVLPLKIFKKLIKNRVF
jgi:hypothetical protein